MEFYIDNENKQWHDTLKFLRLIRQFWNILNVRSPRVGEMKRDVNLLPFTSVSDDRLTFLRQFTTFLVNWRDTSLAGLSKETNEAAQQTCRTVIELIFYLKSKGFKYILTGLFQSDPLEKRFGIYRQMSGSNYIVSVRQVFESERKLKIQSLLKYHGFNTLNSLESLDEIHEQSITSLEKAAEIISLLSRSESILRHDESDFAIFYYIAGYASRVVIRRLREKCTDCVMHFTSDIDDKISLEFEAECTSSALSAEFTRNIDRGGLCHPSESVFFLCNLCTKAFQHLTEKHLMNKLLDDRNPRQLFVEIITATIIALDPDTSLDPACEAGHDLNKYWRQLIVIFFHCLSKNFVKSLTLSGSASSSTKLKKLRG